MLIRKNYFLYNAEKGGKELAGSARLTVQENTWKLELQWKDNGAHLLESGDAVVLQHSDREIFLSSLINSTAEEQQSQQSEFAATALQPSIIPQQPSAKPQSLLQNDIVINAPAQQQSQASATASSQQLQQSSTSNNTGAEQQMQSSQSVLAELQWQDSLSGQQSPQRQESVAEQPQMECAYMPQSTIPSYWETIRAQCDRIEGCAELGEVYRIGKGDFALLPEQLRHMLQNSFLIHGLMNYGYLILCRKEEEQQEVRLGVPGVYYEKEKLVAEMFGFDSFWCQEKSDNGKFGYYLRIVA